MLSKCGVGCCWKSLPRIYRSSGFRVMKQDAPSVHAIPTHCPTLIRRRKVDSPEEPIRAHIRSTRGSPNAFRIVKQDALFVCSVPTHCPSIIQRTKTDPPEEPIHTYVRRIDRIPGASGIMKQDTSFIYVINPCGPPLARRKEMNSTPGQKPFSTYCRRLD